jgi:hypothetical protein
MNERVYLSLNFGGKIGRKHCSQAFERSKEAKIPSGWKSFSG